MPTVAIDGRKYFDFGIGTYVKNLVNSLGPSNGQLQYLLYTSPEDIHSMSLPTGWTKVEIPYKKYSAQEILLFGMRAKKDGVAVFHAPHYTLPIGLGRKSLVTIHDIIHIRFPEYFDVFQRAYSHAMIWHSLRHSRFVITDSEFTKRDILKSFRVNEEKIHVIHLGVSSEYRQIDDSSRLSNFRERFQLQRPYVLYVGNVKPHKGLGTLLDVLNRNTVLSDVDLVLVGGSIEPGTDLVPKADSLRSKGRIHQLGRINDEDMVCAYNAAEVLVMPSLYEGFGLPALEAMACGIPVIASDGGSLPEIVGDAALSFHARDTDELASALINIFRDSGLRRDLVEKGKMHVQKFTWAVTASKTKALYEQTLDS